jgi:hypothetical protein
MNATAGLILFGVVMLLPVLAVAVAGWLQSRRLARRPAPAPPDFSMRHPVVPPALDTFHSGPDRMPPESHAAAGLDGYSADEVAQVVQDAFPGKVGPMLKAFIAFLIQNFPAFLMALLAAKAGKHADEGLGRARRPDRLRRRRAPRSRPATSRRSPSGSRVR